jgi:hypothetical protein
MWLNLFSVGWLIAVRSHIDFIWGGGSDWFKLCCPCENVRQTVHVANVVSKSHSNCSKPRPLSIKDFSISILILVSVISSCMQRILFMISISVVEITPLFFWSVTLSLVQVAAGWLKLSCNWTHYDCTVLYFVHIWQCVWECVMRLSCNLCKNPRTNFKNLSSSYKSEQMAPKLYCINMKFHKSANKKKKNKGSFYTPSY